MSRPRIHVVVGVRFPPNQPERERNALATLAALDCQTLAREQYRVILVEEAPESRMPADALPFVDEVGFLHSKKPYNRGGVFNEGVRLTNADPQDILCMIDSDLLVPRDFLEQCQEMMRQREMMIPYDRIRYLNNSESDRAAAALAGDDRESFRHENYTIDTVRTNKRNNPGEGGVLWIRAETFEEIGQYDDGFIGWGCEDSDLLTRLELRLGKGIERPAITMAHLWHKDAPRGEPYMANLRRFKQKRNPKLNAGEPPEVKAIMALEGRGRTFHFGPKAQRFGRFWTVMMKRQGRLAEIEMLNAIADLNVTGTYVDVGAHVGNHTAFFAGCCKSTQVIAIEPDVDRMAALQEMVQLSKLQGVRTMCVGTWSRPGFVVPTKTLAMEFTETPQPMAIPTRTLDDILADVECVALIKLDTEGSEREILKGADAVLGRCRPHLFVETIRDAEFAAIGKMLGPEYQHVATYNATPTHHWAPVS